MKTSKKFWIILLAIFVLVPVLASAHQPRINTSIETIVTDPEISKAYYGQLAGEPHIYDINWSVPFDLYVNILMPDIVGQKKDVNLALFKKGNSDELLTVFDEGNNNWKKFFEPFAHDTYWQGGEYKVKAEAGNYQIRVWSSENDSKYSLAIGEKENFNFKETVNAINLIPQIKRNFFNENPINFILSPFGWGYILVMYLLAFIVGFIVRLIFKIINRNKINKVGKNINKKDRLIRAVLGIALLLIAITTTWNPILLFLSGFMIFQSVFPWCIVYQFMGKNTCLS